jgi:uncharacterized protein YllA (UPF0747 family)
VLAEPSIAEDALETTGTALKEQGYHRQLSMPDNRLPLFTTGEDGQRRPLIPREGGVEVEGAGVVDPAALADPDGPWLLDPSAALRPVLQDHLLPTAVFVGGPSEMAYTAQIGPIYAGLGVPRPVALPRARARLLPKAVTRILEKYDLQAEGLADGPAAAAKEIARQRFPDDLEESFEKTGEAVAGRLEGLKQRVVAFDPTLGKPFDGIMNRMEGELHKLREKAAANQSRQMETLHDQLERTALWLYPDGEAQERRLNLLPFAVRHSPTALFDLLLDRLDPLRPQEVQDIDLREIEQVD